MVEADHGDRLCAEIGFDHDANALLWHAEVREKKDEDPALEELKGMGEQGLIIMCPREEVVEILHGQNRCAAWFEQAQSDAVRKFRSLRYTIDETDPQYTLKIQGADGRWHYQQPYVASSMEDASINSTITINGRGAFSSVYVGGTLHAQVVALLHEFSHVVGLLPADGGSFVGRELSTQNTQIVLRHCRAQVEAAGKRKSLILHPGTGVFPRDKQRQDETSLGVLGDLLEPKSAGGYDLRFG